MLSRIAPRVARLGTPAFSPLATTTTRCHGLQQSRFLASNSNKPPYKKQSRPSQHPKKNQPPPKNEKPFSPASSSKDAGAASAESEAKNQSTPESTDESVKEVPLDSLPDLTKGIPSTLEYEMAGSAPAALTEGPERPEREGPKRELPASAYVSSTDRKRQNVAKYFYLMALVGLVSGAAYMGRDWDEDEAKRYKDIPNGWGLSSWWNRATARSGAVMTYFSEPAFEALLPKLDPMLEKPYTLCFSLEDLLVHSEWSREHGWRVAKRPGVDYFLRYLSQYYELVIFTTVPSAIAAPVVQKLDPFQMVMFPLFREATKYKDGEWVKDLSYLNRDLSKVIIIDTDKAHVSAQPENAVILPKWKGHNGDGELVDLIPFLEYIAIMQYDDVRKVLKSFEGKHIPTEFAHREALARAEFQKQRGQKEKAKAKHSVGFLGGLLGLKPSNMSMMVSPDGEQNTTEAFAEGKMLQDIARERGKRYMEMLEKDIRENGERYLAEQKEAMEKQQKEIMDSYMGSFADYFVPPTGDKKDQPAKAGDEKPTE